jgi:hypothetical protein
MRFLGIPIPWALPWAGMSFPLPGGIPNILTGVGDEAVGFRFAVATIDIWRMSARIRQDVQLAIHDSRFVRTRKTAWHRHPAAIDGPLGFKHSNRTYTKRGTRLRMKRAVAIAAFLAAFAVLTKLAFKPVVPDSSSSSVPITHSPNSPAAEGTAAHPDPKSGLIAKYRSSPPEIRDTVARVAERFGRNAQEIERTDGLRGLVLLDRLDLEAIFLYEKHPAEFRKLRDFLGQDAAADLLLHWREYFGLKRADDTDRAVLITQIADLTPAQQRLAARYPSALPLILAEPAGMTELVERMTADETALSDALAILSFISLERGSRDLQSALLTLDRHGPIAVEAVRRHGPEGFALVSLYGPVLEALGDALPLDQSLILLQVNSDYVDKLLQTHRPETIAGHLRHVAAAGLIEAVGGSPEALRLIVEFGERGERALKLAGPDAADVVFGDFTDPTSRRQATDALAAHGAMALAMLDKYASDPDFREILRTHGAAVIPPVAQADAGPEALAYLEAKTRRSFTESLALAALFASGDNGQATIRTIKNDGLDRVAQLNQSGVQFYQFLPLYDVIHLGNVVRRGYAPTSGELTWAVVDGCFVITDVLSLAALQPEGVVAAESVRSEVKATLREGVKTVGRELAASGSESAGKSLARREALSGLEQATAVGTATTTRRVAQWWAVRSAGGIYRVLRRVPEALPHLSLAQLSAIAGPLSAKAGLRLSTWRPIRLLKDGAELVLRIPPERGLKYLAAQGVQAGVGVVGFQKMEEHLASKRPQSPPN